MSLRRIPSLAAALTLALVSTACEDEVTGPGDETVEGELTIDASDQLAFTYFAFTDGGSVVSVTSPGSSTDWDMAFRRFTVKLNGGVSGPGEVAGVNLENNAALDSAGIVDFTLDDADAAFDAVTDADIVGVTFVEDGLVEDATAYLSFGGAPAANPQNAWKVQLADGEHAVVRAVDFTFGGPVSFEVRHQPSGSALSSIDTVTADVSGGPVWIDLESGATVGPAGCNWDISVSPGADLTLNAACSAGTFPLDASEDFSAITAADDAPEYAGFLAGTAGAFPSSFSGPEGIFWYNVDGSMRLLPTYNVFLVRVGAAVYKVQIVDYYSATGASGFPTMRYEQIQ